MKLKPSILSLIPILGAIVGPSNHFLVPTAFAQQPEIALGPSFAAGDGLVTDIQHAPGDPTRLFVVTRNGRIKILTNYLGDSGTYVGTFLDISGRITAGGERGLLGLAFDPNYEVNGYFYVNYSRKDPLGATALSRFRATNTTSADPSSETIFETISQDFSNHNGGQLQFGPDGLLYVAMGDGGSGGDPNGRAQDTASLLGKMLRFNVTAAGGWGPAGNLGAPFNDRIWSYGLRNPWRFSFDSGTGDLFIADVGQNAWEEVNYLPSDFTGRKNYGWKVCEGLHAYSGSENCGMGQLPVSDYIAPIFEYPHQNGACSITGGYVYRGNDFAFALNGVYFYADYCTGEIRGAFPSDASNWTAGVNQAYTTVARAGTSRPTTFGVDLNGELFVGFDTGDVRRITSIPCNKNGVCDTADGEDCRCEDCVRIETVTTPTSTCPNNFCEPDEDCVSCPQDCRGITSGKPSDRYCCSASVCASRPVDCGAGAFECGGYQGTKTVHIPVCCGDNVCEGGFEDATTCPNDCVSTPAPTPPSAPPPTTCSLSGQKASACGARGSVFSNCCSGFICDPSSNKGTCMCNVDEQNDAVVNVGLGSFTAPVYPLSGSGSYVGGEYRVQLTQSRVVAFRRTEVDNTHPFELCRSSTIAGLGCPSGDSIKVLSDPSDCAIIDTSTLTAGRLWFVCVPHRDQMAGEFTFLTA